MKVQTKVYLPADVVRSLDDAARRMRKPKSEIVRAAVASYLSPDGAASAEASLHRRLDRLTRQYERLEREMTISTEAVALFVRTWLKNMPAMALGDERAAGDRGRERYARFIEMLGRRLAEGRLLRDEVVEDRRGGEAEPSLRTPPSDANDL
jgi:predicted transcriptional regulator